MICTSKGRFLALHYPIYSLKYLILNYNIHKLMIKIISYHINEALDWEAKLPRPFVFL